MRLRRLRRRTPMIALTCAVLLALTLGGPSLISAHATLLRTDPADGAVLAHPPKQIHLWFAQSVLLNFSHFALVDSAGKRTPISHAHGAAPPSAATQSTSALPASYTASETPEVLLDMPSLTRGAYLLDWQVVSADDLHSTSGQVAFGVGVQIAPRHSAADATSAAPSAGEVVVRWLNFAGIAGLVGALALALLIMPHTRPGEPSDEARVTLPVADTAIATRRRLLGFALASGCGALLASLILLGIQAATTGGALQSLLTTGYGVRWALGTATLLALLACCTVLYAPHTLAWASSRYRPRFQDQRTVNLVLSLLVVVLLLSQALQSHTTTTTASTALDVAMMTLHLLSACLWTGGLGALIIACLPLLRRGGDGVALALATLRRFGLVALVSVIVLSITGLYAAGKVVATPDALLISRYGQTLLLKVGLVLVVGAIGLLHAASLHPTMGEPLARILRRPPGWRLLSIRSLSRTLLVEAGGGLLVVLLAAALAASAPALGPTYEPITSTVNPASAQFNGPANDLYVIANIRPNRPGPVFITIGVYNTRRPAPAQITGVDAFLLSPTGDTLDHRVATALGGDNYQITGVTLARSGSTGMRVLVHRDRLPVAELTLNWTVASPTPPGVVPHATILSQQPLAPLADGAAVALLILAVGAGGVLYARSRRTPAPVRAEAEEDAALVKEEAHA